MQQRRQRRWRAIGWAVGCGAAVAGGVGAAHGPAPAPAVAAAVVRAAVDPAAIDPYDLAVVHDYRLTFDRPDWEAALAGGATLTADLDVDGAALADVAVSLKGNSSQRTAGRKKPLNLTLDAQVDGQNLGGHDVVNLNNGFSDPTFVREALTSASLAPYMPMPRIGWARVHVNGAYFGFYVASEQIEGTFIRRWFRSANGWRFKADPPETAGRPAAAVARAADGLAGAASALARPDRDDAPDQRPGGGGGFGASLAWLGEDVALYQARYELKTPDGGEAAWTGLRELTRALDAPVAAGGASDAGLPAALADHLDVDRALWYLAAMNLYANFDSYYVGHNYYLWRADEDRRFHILAWDINESFGTFPGGGVDTSDTAALAAVDPFHLSGAPANPPLLRRVIGHPAWRADYLAHYRTLLAAFQPAAIERDGAAYQAVIRDSVLSDPNPLYGTALFETALRDDVRLPGGGGGPGGSGGRPAAGIVQLATLRQAHLKALPALAPPPGNLADATRDHTPGSPTAADDVHIGLRWDGAWLGEPPATVGLRYAVDGGRAVELPMAPVVDGGVQQWRATIPRQPAGAEVAYHLRVVWSDGTVGFVPAANLTRPSRYTVAADPLPPAGASDVVINEIVADNGDGDVDEAGEHEDWVELHNAGSATVALTGTFLSDDPANPRKWPLPDLALPAGGFIAIWCDEDRGQGPLHANFKLSKAGERLMLSTVDAVLDDVTFGEQATDVSWARQPDGTGPFAPCARPSRGAANACGGPGDPTPPPTAPSGSATPPPTAPRPTDVPPTAGPPTSLPPSTPTPVATDEVDDTFPHRAYLPRALR